MRIRWTTACVHIGWTTGCVHPVGHLMSASALQPHASIRVSTASATSGGPLDVATSGGPPVAHWWSSGCNDIWWTTGCASRLCSVGSKWHLICAGMVRLEVQWLELKFKYWSVWIGLRQILILILPSSWIAVYVSKNTSALSSFPSVVNLMSGSSEFRWLVNSSAYCFLS